MPRLAVALALLCASSAHGLAPVAPRGLAAVPMARAANGPRVVASRRAAAPQMGLAARVTMSVGALAARPRLLTAASLVLVAALVTIARSSFKFTEVMLPALKKDAPPEQGRGVVAAEAEAAVIISEAVAELVAESTPEPTPEPELAIVTATTPAGAPRTAWEMRMREKKERWAGRERCV